MKEEVRAPAAQGGPEDGVRLVCFRVRGQELGIAIEAVRETIRMRPITRVFLTPGWLLGIFSLRGEILPAVDLSPWLGTGRTMVGEESRLVVLRRGGGGVGVVADELAELRVLPREEIAAPPPTLSAEQAGVISGVAATETGTVRILDAKALLGSARMLSIGRAGAE
ncbi:MAG: chemotaxis protein CheW [Polyangiaceae bacterium]